MEHVDTEFPTALEPRGPPHAEADRRDFRRLKFELSIIAAEALHGTMKIRRSPYHCVLDLHERVVRFEEGLPIRYRCPVVALPSSSASSSSRATELTPTNLRHRLQVRTRSVPYEDRFRFLIVLTAIVQQYTLALVIANTLISLHRPYYARALSDPKDPGPTRSAYAASYLAVIEQCNTIVRLTTTIYSLYPAVVARHWFFWVSVFTVWKPNIVPAIDKVASRFRGRYLCWYSHTVCTSKSLQGLCIITNRRCYRYVH